MDDIWFEIPELVPRVREVVSDAQVKATYAAGPAHQEQSGSPAELWIGVANSALNGQGVDVMTPVARDVAARGLAWLGGHALDHADTMVVVMFADASEGRVFSSFNALETFRFVIGPDGHLAVIRSAFTAEEEAKFRAMRYRMSGRKPPN